MNFILVMMIIGLFAFSACRQGDEDNGGELDNQPSLAGGENMNEESDNEEAGDEEAGGEEEGEENTEEETQEEISVGEVQEDLTSLPVVASQLTEAQKAGYTRVINRTAVNTATLTTVVCTLEGVEGSLILKANKYRRFGRGETTVLCDLFVGEELMAFALHSAEYCQNRLQEVQEELQNQVENLQCEEQ